MVYKGDLAREREIVQSLVEHYHELGEMRNFISILHPQAIKEVLQEMNIESLRGFDLEPLKPSDWKSSSSTLPACHFRTVPAGTGHPGHRLGKNHPKP
jgi:hypothetical protein